MVFRVLIFLALTSAIANADEPRKTAANAVVHKSASAKSRVIGKLPANTPITVVKEAGEWIQIRAKVGRRQLAGFVAKRALAAAPQIAAAEPDVEPEENEAAFTPPVTDEPRKTTEAVVIRKKPGEKQAAVGNLSAGTVIRVEAEQGRWLRIRAGNVAGYIPRTQVTGPAVATDTTAFAPTAPVPATESTRKWARSRDPTRMTAAGLAAFATTDAVLREGAKPEAAEVVRVPAGTRLVVVDATETAGFIRVRDEQGHEGYVARVQIGNGIMSSSLASTPRTGPRDGTSETRSDASVVRVPEPIPARRTLAVRVDAGIGYRVLGMDFSSNGPSGFANYLASASAGAAELDLDITLRSSGRIVIGLDGQLGASRSSPGIDYPGPSGPPSKIKFSTIVVDAGLRIGVRARRMFEIAARAGAHYDVFVTSSLDNSAMLPRERLLGSTLGARVDIAPPGSRVSATVHADALVFGSRRQTEGLEDGTNSTARAVWAGVTARFAFGRRFAVLGAFDFGRATTEWTGMSMRDPNITSARRVDSTQLVQVGLSIGL